MCVNCVIFIRNIELPLSVTKYQVPDQLTLYAFLCIKEHFHSAHLFHLWLYESITWFQKYL